MEENKDFEGNVFVRLWNIVCYLSELSSSLSSFLTFVEWSLLLSVNHSEWPDGSFMEICPAGQFYRLCPFERLRSCIFLKLIWSLSVCYFLQCGKDNQTDISAVQLSYRLFSFWFFFEVWSLFGKWCFCEKNFKKPMDISHCGKNIQTFLRIVSLFFLFRKALETAILRTENEFLSRAVEEQLMDGKKKEGNRNLKTHWVFFWGKIECKAILNFAAKDKINETTRGRELGEIKEKRKKKGRNDKLLVNANQTENQWKSENLVTKEWCSQKRKTTSKFDRACWWRSKCIRIEEKRKNQKWVQFINANQTRWKLKAENKRNRNSSHSKVFFLVKNYHVEKWRNEKKKPEERSMKIKTEKRTQKFICGNSSFKNEINIFERNFRKKTLPRIEIEKMKVRFLLWRIPS